MSVRDRIQNPGHTRIWEGVLSGGRKSAIKMPCIAGLWDHCCVDRSVAFPLVPIGEKFWVQRSGHNQHRSDIL